jgi:chlorobactene glucosyltransferase
VNRARHATDKIANGQFIVVRRDAYDELGGHGAVRGKVAEDLALAQLFFRRGRRTVIVLGLDQLSTRMYSSLRELVAGWSKNLFAGAIDATPFGALGRTVLPVILLAFPILEVAPPLVLLAAAFGLVPASAALWAAVSTAALLLWWIASYAASTKVSPVYALAFPLGAAVLLFIAARAILRGRRVAWKGREYTAG